MNTSYPRVDLDWIWPLRESVWQWLQTVRDPAVPGVVRFSNSGSTHAPSVKTGLGFSCFALKTAYQLNRLSSLGADEHAGWIDHVKSFQLSPQSDYPGFFQDCDIVRASRGGLLTVLRRRLRYLRKFDPAMILRAETRQACATILAAGSRPAHPVGCIPQSVPEVRQFLSSLPWDAPWGAGSHASHLVFLLHTNALYPEADGSAEELLQEAMEFLDQLQDRATGSWFRGSPENVQRVNAAMKVITAYAAVGREFSFPERLIDFCLEVAEDGDACNVLDVIFVIHQCSKVSSHRKDDIQRFAEQQLAVLKSHHRDDGGFSFYPHGAGTVYYGAPVSKGLLESDVHGTHLLTWALTMVAEILGVDDELGWRVPIT